MRALKWELKVRILDKYLEPKSSSPNIFSLIHMSFENITDKSLSRSKNLKRSCENVIFCVQSLSLIVLQVLHNNAQFNAKPAKRLLVCFH